MSSLVRRSLGLLLLAGCASRPPAEPEQPGQYDYSKISAEVDEQMPADLRSRPGDREPVAREIVRTTPIPMRNGVAATTVRVEIRNRCDSPVAIAIGPADVTPSTGDTLAANEAVLVAMTATDYVHMRGADGAFHPANRVRYSGGPIVTTCEGIAALEEWM